MSRLYSIMENTNVITKTMTTAVSSATAPLRRPTRRLRLSTVWLPTIPRPLLSRQVRRDLERRVDQRPPDHGDGHPAPHCDRNQWGEFDHIVRDLDNDF